MSFKFRLPIKKHKSELVDNAIHFVVGLSVGGLITYAAITAYRNFL